MSGLAGMYLDRGIRVSGSDRADSAALRALAVDALTKGIGGTLTTNSLLQERLGLGAGTIQRALDALAELSRRRDRVTPRPALAILAERLPA